LEAILRATIKSRIETFPQGGLVMEAGAAMNATRVRARRVVVVGALGGVLAGMVMALTEMLYGWASSAHTVWDAPMAIWAWVGGLDQFGRPADHIGAIVLGLDGHLVNSMIAGVVFVALLRAARLRNALVAVVLGVAYGLVLWVIMRYGILPLRASTKVLFTTSMVSPQWVWWLAHGLFGVTLGTVYVAVRRGRRRPLAAGSRRREQPLELRLTGGSARSLESRTGRR
jgi:hypothetical protein